MSVWVNLSFALHKSQGHFYLILLPCIYELLCLFWAVLFLNSFTLSYLEFILCRLLWPQNLKAAQQASLKETLILAGDSQFRIGVDSGKSPEWGMKDLEFLSEDRGQGLHVLVTMFLHLVTLEFGSITLNDGSFISCSFLRELSRGKYWISSQSLN